MLPMGYDKSVIELGDGVVKRLHDYIAADVGQCPGARRRRCTTTKAQQKQSGANSVGVGNAQRRAEITHRRGDAVVDGV